MTPSLRKWWLVSLLVKMVFAAILPLSADESYYWVWSKGLSLSYFDHPAMVAWLFKLGEPLEFLGQAVRWPAVIMGHLTLWVWFLILKPYLDEQKLNFWFVLCLFAPLVGFGSIVVTPDLPVLFFWSLSILALVKTLKDPSPRNSIMLGAALGLGFCSKYHIVIFVPCALAYIFFEKLWSKVKLSSLLLVILAGAFFSAPVLIWNYQNDFVSFIFQINHGLVRSSWDPFWSYSYVIGQIVLLFPITLWLALKVKLSKDQRFLLYFTWGPLIFFFLSSFGALVEMNWPIIGYHSFYALAAMAAPSVKPIRWTVGLWISAAIILLSQIFYSWNSSPPQKIQELHLYVKLAPYAQKYQPFFAETYQMASSFWYISKIPTYKLNGMSRHDFYDGLPQSLPTTKFFYMVVAKYAGYPAWLDQQGYKRTILEDIDETFILIRFEKP